MSPLACRLCGGTAGPFTADGMCEDCAQGVEPGLYDIPAELYHADPVPGRSLSSTGARTLATQCPAAYKYTLDNPQPFKKAFDIGTAAHKLVLDDGPELVLVDAAKWNTDAIRAEVAAIRAEGKVPLKRADLDQVHAMAAALLTHEEAARLLDPGSGAAEQSAFWNDGGIWRRARFDWLRHDGQIVDYKTTRSARPDDLPHTIHTYGYHQQQEWYTDAGATLGVADADRPMQFVFQETQPPYLVTVTTCDPVGRSIGRHLNERALNTFALCAETGMWPGYLPAPVTALPAWVERQYA
ncbi:PD-(D/E)XK nuclease-like domain-containing protein [Streptomyces uncialis]|uniref:PD-(D/E)XK nuclease-like domain-containing protein n=1 Tax=Streptomyces uncialis TaxID=1048205 RepID=UPI00381663AE